LSSQLPLLNKKILSNFQSDIPIRLPKHKNFELPNKIIQFGEGVFIRAFFNYFIEIANQNNIFNGRAIVIQPVHIEKSKLINDQDGLFTLCSRGLKKEQEQVNYFIISSISKAFAAKIDWNEILKCSEDPQIEVIVSNTTEAGITYNDEDRMNFTPPISYPGKLTSLLYHRYEKFDASNDAGFIILPLELVENNAVALKKIIKKLIKKWQLEKKFLNWLEKANIFCNTLVDRITTGYPQDEIERFRKILKFEDKLLNTSELYHLWVIEGGENVRKKIPFDEIGLNIRFVSDLTPFYLRKVRILNGAHTSMVHMSYLIGNNYVKESVEHPLVGKFIKNLLNKEIIPSMNMPKQELMDYAKIIIERFDNPYIKHLLLNITLHSNTKIKYRILPSLFGFYNKFNKIPKLIALGFAAFLYFMKVSKVSAGKYYGMRGEESYEIRDDEAVLKYYTSQWGKIDPKNPEELEKFVTTICKNKEYWEKDLTTIGNFKNVVTQDLIDILNHKINFTLDKILKNY